MDDLNKLLPQQLYEWIEDLISIRSVHGRGRTEQAAYVRATCNPDINRLRRELRKRGLPSRQWQFDAEQQAADIADLYDTQESAV